MKSNTKSLFTTQSNSGKTENESYTVHQLYNLLYSGKITLKEYLANIKVITEQ